MNEEKIKVLNYILKSSSFRLLNWVYVENALCRIDNNFPVKLHESCRSLTEEDIRILFLMRLGIGNKEIAQLLSILPSSLRLRRYRIKQKLAITNVSLGDWVKNLYC